MWVLWNGVLWNAVVYKFNKKIKALRGFEPLLEALTGLWTTNYAITPCINLRAHSLTKIIREKKQKKLRTRIIKILLSNMEKNLSLKKFFYYIFRIAKAKYLFYFFWLKKRRGRILIFSRGYRQACIFFRN